MTKLDVVFIRGVYRGSINQAVVKYNCPMLFSKAVLSDWGADLRMGRRDIILHTFQVTIRFTDDKVPVIDILDIYIQSLSMHGPKLQGSTNSQTMYHGLHLHRTTLMKLEDKPNTMTRPADIISAYRHYKIEKLSIGPKDTVLSLAVTSPTADTCATMPCKETGPFPHCLNDCCYNTYQHHENHRCNQHQHCLDLAAHQARIK